MKKGIIGVLASFGVAVALPLAAFAHVQVTPATVNVGASTLFSISVPNERDDDVVSVKLDIPKGVSDVMPDVAGGWTIATEKSGDAVTSITWTGTIPSGQRADLTFKAQAPSASGTISWKAYQTYADGTVVSWNQAPVANEGDNDSATSGPYSVTKVTDDLATSTAPKTDSSYTTLTLVLSIVAIVFSVAGLLMRRRS